MADKVIPLYSNPEAIGKQWAFDEKGPDLVDAGQTAPKDKLQASLSGPAPKFSSAPKPGPMDTGEQAGMMGTKPVAKAGAARAMTPEELSAMADQMLAQVRAEHAVRMAAGPAVRPNAEPREELYAPSQLHGLDRQATPPWLDAYMAKEKKKGKP